MPGAQLQGFFVKLVFFAKVAWWGHQQGQWSPAGWALVAGRDGGFTLVTDHAEKFADRPLIPRRMARPDTFQNICLHETFDFGRSETGKGSLYFVTNGRKRQKTIQVFWPPQDREGRFYKASRGAHRKLKFDEAQKD